MRLRVERREFSNTTTIGVLFVDEAFHCYTLEDADRKLEDGGEKIHGKTAIPRGTYKVSLTESARFRRVLPLVENVPNFSGIRIHAGNTHLNTEGCILVGNGTDHSNTLFNSRMALEALMGRMQVAVAHGEEIWLEVK